MTVMEKPAQILQYVRAADGEKLPRIGLMLQ